jgi:Cu/Zn superoxide dismutase
MFQAQARWLLLAGLSGSLLVACGDEADPGTPNNTAGSAGTGTSGSAQGGSSSGSGGTSSTAGTMASSGSGGASAGTGSGGTAAGNGGSAAGSGGAAGGSGGASGGSGGGGGSGGAAAPTAVANITGLGANAGKVTGTATFTQGATMTKLVLTLTACPDGVHASHLHQVNDCGNNGEAALNHWVPNGEDLGNYTCAGGTATLEKEKPIATWTVGDGGDADVTKHSFMVHAAGDPTPGGRIGCGVVMKK